MPHTHTKKTAILTFHIQNRNFVYCLPFNNIIQNLQQIFDSIMNQVIVEVFGIALFRGVTVLLMKVHNKHILWWCKRGLFRAQEGTHGSRKFCVCFLCACGFGVPRMNF